MILLQAEGLANIGKYYEAVDLLNPEIERDSANIELLLARARYRRSAGYWSGVYGRENDKEKYYGGARDDFAKLLKLAEQRPMYKPIIYLWLGYLGTEIGAVNETEKRSYFERALALGPANAGALSELSAAVADTDPARAIELLKRSLMLDPSASSYYRLAVLQNKVRQHRDAIKSLELALALQRENSSYYKERETYYRERERAEAGLGISELERKQHLAEGFVEMADRAFKRGEFATGIGGRGDDLGDSYRMYRDARDALAQVVNLDKSGLVSADLVVINAKLARVRVEQKVSGRILRMNADEGNTREVVIDRGSDDGIVAGEEGTLWSSYSKVDDKERKVQRIGTSRVINVQRDSATVQVTMDDPTGDKLVRIGDMVEVGARIPPVGDRGKLWDLMKFHIALTSEDGKKVFADYRMLYHDASAETYNRVLDEIAAEIKSTATRLSTIDLMKTVIKKGRFKDKTLLQVMQNPTRGDVLGMLDDMWQYPATHYGQDVKAARTFAVWVIGEPE